MMKKTAAYLLALALSICSLTACGGKSSATKANDSSANDSSVTDSTTDDSSKIDVSKLVIPDKKLVIDGEEVDTKGLVMMTINDKYEVSFDQYRYFYFSLLNSTGVDFEQLDDEQKAELFKTLTETVESYIKNYYSYFVLADENNVTLDEEDEKSIEETYQSDVESFGSEEDCEKYYLSEYANTEVVKNLIRADAIYNKISTALFGEGGTYYVTKDDFLKFAETEGYAQVKHVLITYSSQAELSDDVKEGFDDLSLSEKLSAKDSAYEALSDADKKVVQEKAKIEMGNVLKKVESGEDFDELIKKYGWDPGMESSPEGYFITEKTQFVKQFLDAAFKLKEGETSGIVESDYGYHILKREPMDMDYVNENADTLYTSYYNEIVNEKGSELLDKVVDEMTITYSDVYDKLSYDSIS